jgi:hypothetical protein
VTGYTDVRTIVSLIIRQNCRPEVSHPMHIIDAIAFTLKAPRRAKVMITHMGFHAILPRAREQGRAAQLVNPLTANSRFAVPVMIAGRAKSLVAGCDGGTTRRSGRTHPAVRPPAGSRPYAARDRFGPPRRCCTEVDRVVHGHWLAWTGLCAPEWAAPRSRPDAPAAPAPGPRRPGAGGTAVPRGRGPASAPSVRARLTPARKCLVGKANSVRPLSAKWGSRSTRQAIDFEFDKTGPVIKSAGVGRWCTCPAQFTHHGAVGVIR